MTGIDRFEANFKSELGSLLLILSADETLTFCSQNCLAEPRDKLCWFLPKWNEVIQ